LETPVTSEGLCVEKKNELESENLRLQHTEEAQRKLSKTKNEMGGMPKIVPYSRKGKSCREADHVITGLPHKAPQRRE
jgi:hypothetical protein